MVKAEILFTPRCAYINILQWILMILALII